MSVQALRWSELDPRTREEVDALVAASRAGKADDRFYSDFGDASGWYLLFGLASVGGVLGCGWMMLDNGFEGARMLLSWIPSNPAILVSHPHVPGFFVAMVVGLWVAVRWTQDATRRGVAVTSDAIAQVRGSKVTLLRYADIAAIEQATLGARGKRFTTVTLAARDGTKLTVYATGRWAEAAAEAIQRSRSGG